MGPPQPVCTGSDSLVSIVYMCPSLVPDSPVLFGEKVVAKNYVNIMKVKVARLGAVFELFEEGEGISSKNPNLFYSIELA